MTQTPALERVEGEQHGTGQRQENDRDRGGAGDIAAFDLSEDVDRRDFRLERNVAGDEDDRSKFADRSSEAERDARDQSWENRRKDDARVGMQDASAKRRGGLFHLTVQLHEHRL